MVKTAVESLGGLDIIIANAAWTRFEDKFGDLDNGLKDEEWDKVRLKESELHPVAHLDSAGLRTSCTMCN